MGKIRVAINGFGRIGRSAFKIAFEKKALEVVAINDLTDSRTLAHLLKYDSAYGIYERDVQWGEGFVQVDKKKIPVLAEKDPAKLPWKKLKVDCVLECTGIFTKDGKARMHIQAGARRVIVSAPTSGEGGVQTFLLGVNSESYKGEEVISNASCTTNSIGPVAALVLENFGIKKGMMTTIHSYTQDQNLITPRMSPYKGLQVALKFPGAEHIRTYNSPYARVDTFKSPAARFAPGLSLKYLDPLPEQIGLSIDGGEINALTHAEDNQALKFLT